MDSAQVIPRHQTAISRQQLSKPIALAVADGILSANSTLFDYGCGRGGDVTRLQAMGYAAHGWDPGHSPNAERRAADVVNLGYVINVIEDPTERARTLASAWALARQVLIVAARPDWEARTVTGHHHGDGIITKRGTFQKFYNQEELRNWINVQLHTDCIAAAPGVFYVFRQDADAQTFLASRTRHRLLPTSRPRRRQALYDAHREDLDALAAFITARGRLPAPEEAPGTADRLLRVFPSLRQAAATLRNITGHQDWDKDLEQARNQAEHDLLVYLALSSFRGRPKASELPKGIALDVRMLFGSYRKACSKADALLHGIADQRHLNNACSASKIGKLTADALYVHVTAVQALDPLLRVYEGCARALTGSVAECTIVKFSRMMTKVSYLSYPDFDTTPHPALTASLRADLRMLNVKLTDFRRSTNPPILHRKETFVPLDYLGRDKFVRLTKQEERAGLLLESATIGTRAGWEQRLQDRGYRLDGHRLIRTATATAPASLRSK
ncbi:DNA phosphorothioation-associated putative methyltransferase [Micromonospora marina]|uniref:DNA phosphorothioation-associated putative methyltransferase n=1 Tax=Micromonospora marina TaxID=307120 RepID=A0A1C5AKZ1_9ACTN|nr:DNA phosphorothioation-associated putative methyltransferase [Micromonospora marina]SCF45843.1 DNA phosphorothioation-associated putative methyltransferase [Micromonospora marina]